MKEDVKFLIVGGVVIVVSVIICLAVSRIMLLWLLKLGLVYYGLM